MKKTSITLLVSACVAAAGGGLYWGSQRQAEPAARLDQASGKTRHQQSAQEGEEPAGSSQAHLSQTVRAVLTPKPVGYMARSAAVRNLSNSLAPADLAALQDFITRDRPVDCQLPSWHGLVDSLINVMRRQGVPTPGLTQTLVLIYQESEDEVLEDYAIQHLRSWYVDRESYLGYETDPRGQDLILSTLLHAASRTDQTYSGTALMGLHAALSSPQLKNEPDIQKQLQNHLLQYNSLLLSVARKPETNKHCRISALQLCAIRGLSEILPTARALAADAGVDPNIRISAIAAIGRLGNSEDDLQLLKSLKHQGRRLAYAAAPAMERIITSQR